MQKPPPFTLDELDDTARKTAAAEMADKVIPGWIDEDIASELHALGLDDLKPYWAGSDALNSTPIVELHGEVHTSKLSEFMGGEAPEPATVSITDSGLGIPGTGGRTYSGNVTVTFDADPDLDEDDVDLDDRNTEVSVRLERRDRYEASVKQAFTDLKQEMEDNIFSSYADLDDLDDLEVLRSRSDHYHHELLTFDADGHLLSHGTHGT